MTSEARRKRQRDAAKARYAAKTPEERATFLAGLRAKTAALTVEQREAKKVKRRAYQAAVPHAVAAHRSRKQALRKRYGISLEEFEVMLAIQGDRCAVCGSTSTRWDVDHDHMTNAVRGVLCHRCNVALGALGDSLESVKAWSARFIAYLERPMPKLLNQFGKPLTDNYCTPQKLTNLLPRVDLDPCSNPRSTVKAKRAYSLERKLDGLKLSWPGSVFVNWPYSDPGPWAQKTIDELTSGCCTEAIVLCKMDPSTDWWRIIARPVLDQFDLWLMHKRIQFDEPPELIAARIEKFTSEGRNGGERSSNNFASAILHHRRADAPPLESLADIASRWGRA